jgi:alanyl-tRNA synthetase
MTERLYYRDSSLLTFSGRVVGLTMAGETARVVLDRSAFYPSSGGQLHDIGTLADSAVIDVVEEDDEVIHILNRAPSFQIGDEVEGRVDAARRRDNMQKHTGQHILSRAFIEICGAATVSSRLGEDDCTVELDRESVDEDCVRRAETRANEIIFENRPVTVIFVPHAELSKYPLRKIPDRQEGDYRIIAIADYDWSACGGTHCTATGSVGLIKITGHDKLRGHVRFHFLTGLMALDDYRWRYEQIEAVAGSLTRHGRESATAVAALIEENGRLRRRVGELRKELLPTLIDSWLQQAVRHENIPIVPLDFSGDDFKDAKDTVLAIIKRSQAVAIAGADDKLMIAVTGGLPFSASDLLKNAIARYGGRGGGTPQLAQGGGFPPGDIKVLLAHPERVFDL